jgi:tetratricopeptide (TPR) repeat protein
MTEVYNPTDAELIIAHNKEEWRRLLFLLGSPESPNVFWINCDTYRLKKPLHDALSEHFPKLVAYDIYIDEKTESLTRIILWEEKDKIPANAIIHVFGMEDATKNTEFIDILNFQRNTLFKHTPGNLIIWADFTTGTELARRAYDFWSWVVFTFDFITPDELLTSRQKGFPGKLKLEDMEIEISAKDNTARIRHLENEWGEFLKSVDGKPSTIKEMKDAVTIARALAMEYRDEGKYNKAIEKLESCLRLNPGIITEIDTTKLRNDLGVAYYNLGDFNKARDFNEKALLGNIKLFGENHLEVARNRSNLAMAYKKLGEFEVAKNLMEQSIGAFAQILEPGHPDISTVKSNLAMIYQDLGQPGKARDLLDELLENDIKNLGEDNPDVAIRRSNLGAVYYDLSDFYKAKSLFEKALESDLKNFEEHHPNVAIRYYNLAYVYKGLNDIQNARGAMEKAYKIYHEKSGENNPDTQSALAFLKSLDSK